MHKRPNPIAVIALAVVLLVPGGAAAQNTSDSIAAMMEAVNLSLAAQGENYRAVVAEYITNADGQEMGNMVIARDVGNKHLDFDFVPGDLRRAWSGVPFAGPDDITYAVDQIDVVPPFGGLTMTRTTAAIDRAMTTWASVNCSTLPIWKNPDFGFDIGVMAFISGLGGSPFIFADVQHAGWGDLDFEGGVLAATFTFGFVDRSGSFTDIDNNKSLDAAFREIYYDPSFSWADDGVTNLDVETVALHEAGHGLSQAHFGKVFIDKRGNLRFAPRAVMNGIYVGSQRALLGTDSGGHCSNWAAWPNR